MLLGGSSLFIPDDENCCYQLTAYNNFMAAKSLTKDSSANDVATKWGEAVDDGLFTSEGDDYGAETYIADGCVARFSGNSSTQFYPGCLGNADYIKLVDYGIFVMMMLVTAILHVYFLWRAWSSRRSEKKKLYSDSISMAERNDEAEEASMLYGWLSENHHRHYEKGLKYKKSKAFPYGADVNHGNSLDAYYICDTQDKNTQDAALGLGRKSIFSFYSPRIREAIRAKRIGHQADQFSLEIPRNFGQATEFSITTSRSEETKTLQF